MNRFTQSIESEFSMSLTAVKAAAQTFYPCYTEIQPKLANSVQWNNLMDILYRLSDEEKSEWNFRFRFDLLSDIMISISTAKVEN